MKVLNAILDKGSTATTIDSRMAQNMDSNGLCINIPLKRIGDSAIIAYEKVALQIKTEANIFLPL